MHALRIASFGSLRAWLDDEPIDLGGAKTRALFGYLAAAPSSESTRGSLAALLWPEADSKKSSQSLRSALYQLRRNIDSAANDPADGPRASDALLSIGQTRVSFHTGAVASSDVFEFKQAMQRISDHEHDDESTCAVCIEDLKLAADLYQGEFLADVSVAGGADLEDWLLLQREAFQNQALRVLDRLVQVHLRRDEYVAAHDRAFQLLGLNRYDEFAHRAIMSSLGAQGHFDQAAAHYKASAELIRDEIGVEPSAETVELALSLQEISQLRDPVERSARTDVPSIEFASQPERSQVAPQTCLSCEMRPL